MPPASFRLSVNAAANPLKSSSNANTSLRELRGGNDSNIAARRSSLRPPISMPVSTAQEPLCRTQISSERQGTFHPRNDKNHSSEQHHSYTPHLDDSSFKPITLLTRKSSPSPKAHRATQRSSFPTEEMSASQSQVPRKDPSDMWFDCGEELQETEIIPLASTVPLTFEPDRLLLTDHKLSRRSAANDSPLRQSVFSSADEDGGFAMMSQTLEAVITSECKSPLSSAHQSSTLPSLSSRYNDMEQARARDTRIGLIIFLIVRNASKCKINTVSGRLFSGRNSFALDSEHARKFRAVKARLLGKTLFFRLKCDRSPFVQVLGTKNVIFETSPEKLCAALLFLGHHCSA